MNIIALREPENSPDNVAPPEAYAQLTSLLQELRSRELPDKIISLVNEKIDLLNSSHLTGDDFRKSLKQMLTSILKMLEKELKIVPKNHYRTLWLSVGMAAFGLPIGAAIGTSTGNMALLSIGLPIGMGIGIVVGSAMDKKAADEGRQLDL